MNVLRDQCPFFTVPADLVDAGHLQRLSGSAVKLYYTLFRLAQRHSAVQIEIPDYETTDHCGLDPKSARKARRELEQAGLVVSKKNASGVTVYLLLNPGTGMPLPPPAGRRGLKKFDRKPGRNARSARAARQQMKMAPDEPRPYPLAWDEIAPAKAREPGEEPAVPVGEDSRRRWEVLPTVTGKRPDAEFATSREQEVYFGA